MEDPELQEIFDRFISNRNIEDSAKIQKLKQLLVVFSNRWAEERTISAKYRDKCYELLEYTDKSLKMVDKLKESLLHEQAKSRWCRLTQMLSFLGRLAKELPLQGRTPYLTIRMSSSTKKKPRN